MSDPRADVALLVDFTDLRQSFCPEHGGGSAEEGADAAEGDAFVAAGVTAREVARHLLHFASDLGRVAVARAYADWSRCGDLARDLGLEQLEPVLVPGTDEGEDRSHIRLVVEALEALYAGDEPDAFVLVTGDPTLLPLVQKLRADGSQVLIVAPSESVAQELADSADQFVPLEDVLRGVTGEPVQPRAWRGGRSGGSGLDDLGRGRGGAARGAERRERSPHPTPVQSEADFDCYDWGPFVRLIDELEHRLPFVGVRYLVNKVLGAHNCGIDDPRLKRALINRAVEEGVIVMYPVGNVGDRADPVTACRLNRQSPAVVEVIGDSETPVPPPEHSPEDVLDSDE